MLIHSVGSLYTSKKIEIGQMPVHHGHMSVKHMDIRLSKYVGSTYVSPLDSGMSIPGFLVHIMAFRSGAPQRWIKMEFPWVTQVTHLGRRVSAGVFVILTARHTRRA